MKKADALNPSGSSRLLVSFFDFEYHTNTLTCKRTRQTLRTKSSGTWNWSLSKKTSQVDD